MALDSQRQHDDRRNRHGEPDQCPHATSHRNAGTAGISTRCAGIARPGLAKTLRFGTRLSRLRLQPPRHRRRSQTWCLQRPLAANSCRRPRVFQSGYRLSSGNVGIPRNSAIARAATRTWAGDQSVRLELASPDTRYQPHHSQLDFGVRRNFRVSKAAVQAQLAVQRAQLNRRPDRHVRPSRVRSQRASLSCARAFIRICRSE
jgi:hypothetical protein